MNEWNERCTKHQTRNCYICYPISKRGVAPASNVLTTESTVLDPLPPMPIEQLQHLVRSEDAFVKAASETANAKAMLAIAQSTYDDAARALENAGVELGSCKQRYSEAKRLLKDLVNKEE